MKLFGSSQENAHIGTEKENQAATRQSVFCSNFHKNGVFVCMFPADSSNLIRWQFCWLPVPFVDSSGNV